LGWDWSLSRAIDKEPKYKTAEESFMEAQKVRAEFRKHFGNVSLIGAWSEEVKASMLEQHKRTEEFN